ncbi:MAG TPA: dienelactone hydrolase family protein [Anaerolineales bacterium]|nr:dienelactone hydrolase family protein [Anaerolineales bacterium]
MTTDFKGYLLSEFLGDYEQGLLTRREAGKLIAGIVGSLTLAESLLAACTPAGTNGSSGSLTPSSAASESPGASSSGPTASSTGAELPTASESGSPAAGEVQIPGTDTPLLAYLARPAGDGPHPAVLVCHENRGLTEHIKDVARRLASAGYVGLAVDLLSRQGGTAAVADSSQIPGMLSSQPPEQFVRDFTDGWRWLQTQPEVRPDGVGMVGFCFGGGVTWRVAIGLADLRAAVPYYGPHPDPNELAAIQGAVLAIYAGRDDRINRSIPAIEAEMQRLGKVYEKVIYPDTDHAFHNDTGSRYDPAAATDAWSRTLAWFDRYLRSS